MQYYYDYDYSDFHYLFIDTSLESNSTKVIVQYYYEDEFMRDIESVSRGIEAAASVLNGVIQEVHFNSIGYRGGKKRPKGALTQCYREESEIEQAHCYSCLIE